MCASVNSILVICFFATLLVNSVMHGRKMVAESHPLGRRQPDANRDILSGADFLSILMDSSTRRKEIETTSSPTTTTVIEIENYIVDIDPQSSMRPSRSTSQFTQSTTEHLVISDSIGQSSDSSNDGVILAVRISSSVGKAIKRILPQPVRDLFDATASSEQTTVLPTESNSRNFISEDVPSINAKSSKSELNVEESEPITKDNNQSLEYEESYPAKVEPLPSPSHSSYDPTADFLNQDFSRSTKQPIQHTVIYHDPSEDSKGARSVSYSSVIQSLPQIAVETDKPIQHERRERNYHGAQVSFINNFSDTNERRKNDTKLSNTQTENKNSFSTATEAWQKSVKSQENQITTERNWESQEKPYVPPTNKPSQLPNVYGRAEQNFEVDEAVSVETNGRAHGVQPSLPPRSDKKHDDNQKVGYVVEGRNYRKYRVEERTPDGFIVGEYGVVSHNDGSLRGVRYTADGTINPRLISEALLKFLSL